jgi:hypothetical protein
VVSFRLRPVASNEVYECMFVYSSPSALQTELWAGDVSVFTLPSAADRWNSGSTVAVQAELWAGIVPVFTIPVAADRWNSGSTVALQAELWGGTVSVFAPSDCSRMGLVVTVVRLAPCPCGHDLWHRKADSSCYSTAGLEHLK